MSWRVSEEMAYWEFNQRSEECLPEIPPSLASISPYKRFQKTQNKLSQEMNGMSEVHLRPFKTTNRPPMP